jgi:primosomal protein N' (replication factor Y)
VVIVGAASGVEKLTYAIPSELTGRLMPGHRVLVPLRSRRVTAMVLEIGDDLDSGGAQPKPILELLEPRPLFDRAHLALVDFLASYYMASLGDAYRSVIPAAARVESRQAFRLRSRPGPLALAAFTPLERRIADAIASRPMTLRQLDRLGDEAEIRAALSRLESEGIIERRDATRGRHREKLPQIARLAERAEIPTVRGRSQKWIVDRLAKEPEGIRVEDLLRGFPAARAALGALADRGLVVVSELAFAGADARAESMPGRPAAEFELTAEQKSAISIAAPAVRDRRFAPFLLWGVTASGKTEVYLRLAAETLSAGRQVLVMVPEIALADQIVRAFRERFGKLVAVAHSAQNVAERWSSWMAALSGDARVIIGPRSAVFAPLHDIGLIVVDEEHDPAYKQEEGIRYNARDLAVALGRFSECPVILGSATPSAESYANARRGRYTMLRLTRRVADRAMASVEVVDLREATGAATAQPPAIGTGNDPSSNDSVPLSSKLIDAMRQNLTEGGQSVIFLNRRGYHNFLQCHLCGNVITCANCSVSMTFHLRDHTLRCHYCGANSPAPDKCPECEGFGLEGQGFGTERLVHSIGEMVPEARVERMDSDTSGRRGARTAIVERLRAGLIDILVGTQMITKGFDFPRVTLVGVVLADAALNMPDFRSAERTFQLLTQVAGRAGRHTRPGRVLIQTYAPHHYSIRAARDQDYERFMRREFELRRELMYPPYAKMALVRIEGADPGRVREIARTVGIALARAADPAKLRVLGPAPAPIERIKQRYRWQVVVKAATLGAIRPALSGLKSEIAPEAERDDVRVSIDVDPVSML